jgi:hypothetical protein
VFLRRCTNSVYLLVMSYKSLYCQEIPWRNLNFLDSFSKKKISNVTFHEKSVNLESRVFPCRRKDRKTDRHTDMANLIIVAFRSFAKDLKKFHYQAHRKPSISPLQMVTWWRWKVNKCWCILRTTLDTLVNLLWLECRTFKY